MEPAKSPLKRTTLPSRVSTQMRPKKRPYSRLPLIGWTSKTAVGMLPRKSLTSVFALAADWLDVKDGRGDVAKKVVADEGKGVVLAIEAVRVHEDHLDEAGLVEGEAKAAGDSAECP